MKALKFKLYQNLVCYRKPMSFKAGETYPLPPPSTINGFLHNALGATEYIPMIFSIQGTYTSITNNLQKLYKFGKSRAGRESSYDALIGSTAIKSMVYYTNLLVDVALIIHVKASEDILNRLSEALLAPCEYPSLGRREDLVRIDEIALINLQEKDDRRNGIPLRYPAYIPKQYAADSDLHGINYRLNSYYEIKDGFKKWERVEMLYVESGKIYSNTLVDEQDDVIFWHK